MQFIYLVYCIITEAGAVPFGQLLSPFCHALCHATCASCTFSN